MTDQEQRLRRQASAYRQAGIRLTVERQLLYTAIKDASSSGLTAYRIAKIADVDERHVGRILSEQPPDEGR